MPNFVKRLSREPLVHFLAAGALVFLIFGLVGSRDLENRDITISRDQIEQLSAVFAKTWQRPPSQDEVKALIDDFVKEEIYLREALRLGLDQDDTVIRRRLRQKMEFMQEAEAGELTPAAGELEAYFLANKATFERQPKLALEQVYLDPGKHADAPQAATATLQQLRTGSIADIALLGDASMLPQIVPLSPLSGISAIFGPDFAKEAASLPRGEWSGPVASEYGLHLIRITDREKGSVPGIAEIRDVVLGKWREAKQTELARQQLDALLKSYRIKIDLRKGDTEP